MLKEGQIVNRKSAWGLCAVVGAVAVVVGVAYGRTKNLDAAVWAAWVQAVGSVLAILAAVAVADFHVRSEREGRAEQQKGLTIRVTHAVRNLGVAAHTLRNHAKDQDAIDDAFLARFETYLLSREEAVLSVPMWSIEDQDVVVHLLVMQASIRDGQFLRKDNPARLVRHLDVLVRRCREYLEKYGTPHDPQMLTDENPASPPLPPSNSAQ